MIAQKVMALLNVVQKAAPGNVYTRELAKRRSIVRMKSNTLQMVATSRDVRGSRLPTHATNWQTQYFKDRHLT